MVLDVPTPAELKTAAITSLKNRSESAQLPLPPFQFEPLPMEMVKAFPVLETWLRRQNAALLEHNKKVNTVLQ